jgi:hypothetical protein
MSLPRPDLHVRVSPETRAALRLLADMEQCPDSTLAARIIEEAVMGRFHVLRVAARQASRLGIDGSDAE